MNRDSVECSEDSTKGGELCFVEIMATYGAGAVGAVRAVGAGGRTAATSSNTVNSLRLTRGCLPSENRGLLTGAAEKGEDECPRPLLCDGLVDMALLKPDSVVKGWRSAALFFEAESRSMASAAAMASRAALFDMLMLSKLVGLSRTGFRGKTTGDGVQEVFSGWRERGVLLPEVCIVEEEIVNFLIL